MTKYFFDVNNGDGMSRDETGSEFESLEMACEAAVAQLPMVASEELPDGPHRVMWTRVRDEADKHLFLASLTLDTKKP